jgi:hypothetical protein
MATDPTAAMPAVDNLAVALVGTGAKRALTVALSYSGYAQENNEGPHQPCAPSPTLNMLGSLIVILIFETTTVVRESA